jgi:hypothetical protein
MCVNKDQRRKLGHKKAEARDGWRKLHNDKPHHITVKRMKSLHNE